MTVLLAEPSTGETLVRLDCEGQVRPGLATQWSGDSTGRRWMLSLPTLSAGAVASSWRDSEAVKDLGIDSVVALDDHRLRVTLRATPDSAPRLFADPVLAVSRPRIASGVHLRVAPEKDPRDALDHGADLVVTRDPAVVDYVARRPEFTTFPLPWSRLYVLLQPAATQPRWIRGLDAVRRSLAEDVAPAEARAAEPPFWWENQCPRLHGFSAVAPRISSRIVYPRDDRVARGLAERIVALTRDSLPLTTAGLDSADLAVALLSQYERGYVLGLPRHVPAPCHEQAWSPELNVQPLIETRAHAILRKGAPPLTVDWDGSVRVAEP